MNKDERGLNYYFYGNAMAQFETMVHMVKRIGSQLKSNSKM